MRDVSLAQIKLRVNSLVGSRLLILALVTENELCNYIQLSMAPYTLLTAYTASPLCLLFCFAILFVPCCSEWQELAKETLTMPAYVYKVPLSSNVLVSGEVEWNGRSDIDLYIYKEGSNFFSKSIFFTKFISYNLYIQSFQFSVATTGNYYFRVDPYQIDNTETFKLSIKTNVTTSNNSIQYVGYFTNFSIKMQALLLRNTPINRATSVSINISGTNSITPILISTSSSDQLSLLGSYTCLSQKFSSGSWTVFFNHSIPTTGSTRLTTYDMVMYVDYSTTNCTTVCQDGLVWNEMKELCQGITPVPIQPRNTNIVSGDSQKTIFLGPIDKIIVIVCCSLFGVFVITLIICLVYRHRKKHAIPQIPEVVKQNSSEMNIGFDPKRSECDMCSICLDGMSDSTLVCGHMFHYACITQWYTRNKLCPMCRNQIRIRKKSNAHCL